MILVVDVMKGIQTQTAECLVIGELICPKILVVINKIDLLSKQKKQVSKFYFVYYYMFIFKNNWIRCYKLLTLYNFS